MRHAARVPIGVRGAVSRIPGMLVMGVTEGARGDTEIAAPLVRVAPGAATELVVSGDHRETSCEATVAVVPNEGASGAAAPAGGGAGRSEGARGLAGFARSDTSRHTEGGGMKDRK